MEDADSKREIVLMNLTDRLFIITLKKIEILKYIFKYELAFLGLIRYNLFNNNYYLLEE